MNKRLLLCFIMLSSTAHASDPDKFLGPRDMHGIKSSIERYIEQDKTTLHYGNWHDEQSDNTDSRHPAIRPAPVDSIDAIAQKHNFGYQVAEQQGRIHGVAEENRLKHIVDYIAVCDAKALPENPSAWTKPPADINKALRYRDSIITGFAYQNKAARNKKLDWTTSDIKNGDMDKSHQLNVDDLEKLVSQLQNDWTKQNLAHNAPAKETSSNNAVESQKIKQATKP